MKTWNFLNNTFLNVTDGSYRLCKKIGDYTVNALFAHNADPTITPIHTAFKPFVTTYNNAYAAWINQLGAQKGMTNELMINLKLLQSSKIKKWDIAVQNVYPEGSSAYMAIFPNNRIPFQHGSQEDRIAACDALSLALTGITALASTKTDVDAFIVSLKNSFNVQKGSLSNTSGNSNAVEAARVALCVELYGVLGVLMSKYKNNPSDVEQFFDLESIRNHEQTLFKGSLHASETKLAITHTFIDDGQLLLKNTGTTPLRFALCEEANDDTAAPFVDIQPNEQEVVDAKQLGNVEHRYLKVHNLSTLESGKYSIMLL